MTKQNKEELALKKKQYRQDNQTKYNEYNMRKFKCDCGSTYSYSQKARHERTNKHIKYINQKLNQSL